ncbi:ATP-binding protein [Tautonia plasticadhaerens]|uniref:Uncharacterized protein n=1 Tax=Tautonia plasticadhaerens TaxID=2527974 RepID=A0A518GYE7_9BACT|nr:hypothetical protein [Tautonia plasticadhaerens]QDV33616.1 hypothetical protein ElP_14920 [Tautonia plasticadhaerens]
MAAIREALGPLLDAMDPKAPASPHLATSVAMSEDVTQLTRRYLEYIDQAEALPTPRLRPERTDELLAEVDRRLMAEAFGRGVAWGCSVEGPIPSIRTDRQLCIELLLEFGSMAIDAAGAGDSVSIAVTPDPSGSESDRIRMTLSSSAEELIADLTNLREDPLFNRVVCLEEVGSDPGSRLALCMERLEMIGATARLEHSPGGGLIRAVNFLFPASLAPRP